MAIVTRQKVTCIVEGCNESVHAKGYCRRHYGQIWRKGEISPERGRGLVDENGNPRKESVERLRMLMREIKKADYMYEAVVGIEGRLKWRREIDSLQREINKISVELDNKGELEEALAQM